MPDSAPRLTPQQLKARLQEMKRLEDENLAKLVPRTQQGQISEDDAKRIAAMLREMMQE